MSTDEPDSREVGRPEDTANGAAGPGEGGSAGEADDGNGSPRPEGDDAATSGDPADSTVAEPQDESEQQITQQVHNIFHGQVVIGDSGMAGFTVGENVRRDTGRVAEASVEALSRIFFRTRHYAEALRLLQREHLLLLAGPEGSGRAAAALMLAADGRQPRGLKPPINRLPPTRTLAELARQNFRPGQYYVLQDWIQAGSARAALARFDADHLAQRLVDSQAYLIITTSARSRPGESTSAFEVPWAAPDPDSLFDHCVGRLEYGPVILDEELPVLRERARQLASPRRVVHLVGRLRNGVGEALAEDDSRDLEEVRLWFQKMPDRRALLAAAILVLACRTGDEPPDRPGVTQHGFEVLFSSLEAAEAEFRGDPTPEAGAVNENPAFPQARHSLFDNADLTRFTVDRPTTAAVGIEHYPGFRTIRQRAMFQQELHLRCGHELWSPVRDWLSQLVREQTVTNVHLAIACGIGRMALFETRRVREDYLDDWAAGLTTTRYCAVFALWAMAAEDELAPIALTQARGWIRNQKAERAITAAIALGGPLGKRYPSEATWILWELARRGQRISLYARISFANLLAVEADADDPSAANFLASKVRPLFARGTPTALRRSVFTLILEILSVPGLDPAVPSVTDVLRQSPAAAAPIGELWAAVLCSAPHRPPAIGVLHQTIAAFAQSPDGVKVVTRLGQEILPRLSSAHRRQVDTGLRMSQSPVIRLRMRDALAAFLGATSPRPAGSDLADLREEQSEL